MPNRDKDKVFMSALFHAAELGIAESARLHGISATSLNRKFAQWDEEGKFIRLVLINWHLIGIWPINILFSLSAGDSKSALGYLTEQPQVIWLTELFGTPRYEATVWCRDMGQLARFLDEFSSNTGTQLISPTWACETGFTHWHSIFPMKPFGRGKEVTAALSNMTVQLDSLDFRLLDQLMRTTHNISAIARSLGVSISTLHERYQRLKKHGVVYGSFFYPVWEQFGFIDFSIILSGCQRGPKIVADVIALCRKIPAIRRLFYAVGGWDFKVVGVVESEMEAMAILDRCLETLDHGIGEAVLTKRHRKIRTRSMPFFSEERLRLHGRKEADSI